MSILSPEARERLRRFNESEIKNRSYATSGRKKAGIALAVLVGIGLLQSDNIGESTKAIVSPVTSNAASGLGGVLGGAWGLLSGGAEGVSEGLSDTGVSVDVDVDGLSSVGNNQEPLIIPPQGESPAPSPEVTAPPITTEGSFTLGSFVCASRGTVVITAELPTISQAVLAASPEASTNSNRSIIWQDALAKNPTVNPNAMQTGDQIFNAPIGCK